MVLCVLAFLYGRRRDDLAAPLILIWVAGYAIIFFAVAWHPQWAVLLAPAFALSLGLMKRPGLFLVWESIAFGAFVIVFTALLGGNVDATMITQGILSPLIGEPAYLQANVVGPAVPFANVLLTFFFISPLVWIACERAAGMKDAVARAPHRAVWDLRAVTLLVVLDAAVTATRSHRSVTAVLSVAPPQDSDAGS